MDRVTGLRDDDVGPIAVGRAQSDGNVRHVDSQHF